MNDLERYRCLIRERLPVLRDRFHVATLGLFGSRVRGDARPSSDLDVLVTFDVKPGLIGFIEVQDYLSDELGVKVDLVLRNALKPSVGESILQEVVPV